MESKTYLKNLSITPKKLRMLLPSIKRLSPLEATKVLYYSPKRSSRVFYKAIKSAMANAKQTLKVNDDLLQFKLFTIEEGNKLKRYQAGSRGSAKPFKKRYSHIKIILTAKEAQPSTQDVKEHSLSANNEKSVEKKKSDKKVEAASEISVKAAKNPKKKVQKKNSEVKNTKTK